MFKRVKPVAAVNKVAKVDVQRVFPPTPTGVPPRRIRQRHRLLKIGRRQNVPNVLQNALTVRRIQKLQRRAMPDDHPLLPVTKVMPRPYSAACDKDVRRLGKLTPNALNLGGRKHPYVVNVPRQNGRPKVPPVVQILEQPAVAAVRVKRVPKKRVAKPNPVVPPKLFT